jgi:hypothetical protein
MSHYEYIFVGDLTPEYETKVNDLVKMIGEGYSTFHIHKYTDEEIGNSVKKRCLTVYSSINLSMFFYNHFKDCKLEYRVYFKQRII